MDFHKKCSNCIYCSIDTMLSETEPELWCDNENSKHNNGTDIIDECRIGAKCNFFKNKNIEYEEVFERYKIYVPFSHGKYLECFSNDFILLNNFISESREYLFKFEEEKRKADELKEILSFIKSELPDVYKNLLREYKKRKKLK